MKALVILGVLFTLVLQSAFAAGATISGRIVDVQTGEPLPGILTLYKFEPSIGTRVWVTGTSCYSEVKTGCADSSGNFVFEGRLVYPAEGLKIEPFDPGEYELEAYASGYLLSRQKFVLSDEDVDLGKVNLTHSPVEITLISSSPPLPPQGGQLFWLVRIKNLSEEEQRVDVYALINGPGKSSDFVNSPFGRIRRVILGPREEDFVDQGLTIPSEIPDGSYMCVQIYVRARNDPFMPLGRTNFCTQKGPGPIPSKG